MWSNIIHNSIDVESREKEMQELRKKAKSQTEQRIL